MSIHPLRPPHKDEEGLPKRRPSIRSPAEPGVRHAVPVTCGTGDAERQRPHPRSRLRLLVFSSANTPRTTRHKF